MTEVQQSPIRGFIAYLQGRVQAQDRGVLADLRHAFSPGTEHRAWPHIASRCDLVDARQRAIWQTVAAGFATHEKTSRCGNLGVSLRKIALSGANDKKEDALKSFDARFRRLLTCETAVEVCQRLVPIIRAAKQKDVQIDFERLFGDLQDWGRPDKDVKIRWAATYWSGEESQSVGQGGIGE